MLNREFSSPGTREPADMSLRLTFPYAPQGRQDGVFISSQWRKRCWNICPSVHPSEVPLVPINLPDAQESVSDDQPTQHLPGPLVGRKKLVQKKVGNVCPNLNNRWNYSSSAVPLTDRGNMVERMDVSGH